MSEDRHDKSILVLDDEDHIRNVIARTLTIEGYYVVSASNGPDALLKASQEKFHLAVLDVKMPGMNGLEVLRKLKADYPDIIAIMLTGVAENELTESMSMAEGSAAFLIKPCSLDVLVDTIAKALRADDIPTPV